LQREEFYRPLSPDGHIFLLLFKSVLFLERLLLYAGVVYNATGPPFFPGPRCGQFFNSVTSTYFTLKLSSLFPVPHPPVWEPVRDPGPRPNVEHPVFFPSSKLFSSLFLLFLTSPLTAGVSKLHVAVDAKLHPSEPSSLVMTCFPSLSLFFSNGTESNSFLDPYSIQDELL